MPVKFEGHPEQWRDALDKILTPEPPKPTAEEEAEEAAREKALLDAKWDTWGESEEQLEAQRRFMAMAGPEG